MDKANETVTTPSNAFSHLLSEFNEGQSLTELTEAMQKCVGAANDTGKVSQLRYTIKFTPSGNAIVVTDKIELKLPEVERTQAIFFPTEQNTLQRDNPAQRSLDLRTVEKPEPAEVREVRAAVKLAS
jgi:hypothetical protein